MISQKTAKTDSNYPSFTNQSLLCHFRYSIDGGATWKSYTFSSNNILARDVVTQPGERLPVFLIYGAQQSVRNTWTVFYLNMTSVLGVYKFQFL